MKPFKRLFKSIPSANASQNFVETNGCKAMLCRLVGLTGICQI